ncbi:MAG: amidohydrolase [Bacteroidales bacterium]|nr:amidohydrolase [Bacteroidales bacterium]
MTVDIKRIIDLRLKLHRHPELSGEEFKTAELIEKTLSKFSPDKIIVLAETGRAFIYDSGKEGKTIMFRAELDALPILEPDDTFNKSLNKGVSHKCGHDGHMAILTGLAEAISTNRPVSGKVVLLFQPAEETLSGARTVIDDPKFKEIEPDYIYAIHNLPGFNENSVIIRDGNFTSATNGISIKLTGNTSHAANPEKANNPTDATLELLDFFRKEITTRNFKNFVLATPVYTTIGSPDFGITPGNSEIKVTLRAYDYGDLDKMIGYVQDTVKMVAQKHNLKFDISYTDDAAPVYNNQRAIEVIKSAANENNLRIETIPEPFKWTEDFGYFTIKYKGALVGFGAGEGPNLHDKNYNFNDNIITHAVSFLYSIYKHYNKQ